MSPSIYGRLALSTTILALGLSSINCFNKAVCFVDLHYKIAGEDTSKRVVLRPIDVRNGITEALSLQNLHDIIRKLGDLDEVKLRCDGLVKFSSHQNCRINGRDCWGIFEDTFRLGKTPTVPREKSFFIGSLIPTFNADKSSVINPKIFKAMDTARFLGPLINRHPMDSVPVQSLTIYEDVNFNGDSMYFEIGFINKKARMDFTVKSYVITGHQTWSLYSAYNFKKRVATLSSNRTVHVKRYLRDGIRVRSISFGVV